MGVFHHRLFFSFCTLFVFVLFSPITTCILGTIDIRIGWRVRDFRYDEIVVIAFTYLVSLLMRLTNPVFALYVTLIHDV